MPRMLLRRRSGRIPSEPARMQVQPGGVDPGAGDDDKVVHVLRREAGGCQAALDGGFSQRPGEAQVHVVARLGGALLAVKIGMTARYAGSRRRCFAEDRFRVAVGLESKV